MKDRNKCTIFSETYLPLIGGAEMYTYNFAKQLVRQGYAVTIFTHASGDIPMEYQLPHVAIQLAPKIPKHQVHRIIGLFFQMRRLAKESDLIFANYTYALSTLAVLVGATIRKPVYVFAHGLGTIIDQSHPKIYHLYRYVTLKLANRVITTSDEIARIVRKYTKCVLVATAVDCAAIDASIQDARVAEIREAYKGRKIILTVRRLVEKNGIQYLIETLPYLINENQDFVYLAIGDGRLRSSLEERVTELGIAEHVEFLGALQNKQVFDYIQAADVVVFPSSAEALSLAAIEVMHIGTPLVVSGIGGLLELAGKNEERAVVVDLFGRTESLYTAPEPRSLPTMTYKHFADKIRFATSGTEEVLKKTAEAKTFADKQFDWPQVAERILRFIS